MCARSLHPALPRAQVFDWLTGEVDEGSGVQARSEEFVVDRAEGHARAARACAAALLPDLDAAVETRGNLPGAASDAAAAKALGALGCADGGARAAAPLAHAQRWTCHHLARAGRPRCAEAEAALL